MSKDKGNKNCRRGSVSASKKMDEIAADYNRRIAALRKRQIAAAQAVLASLSTDDE